MFQRFSSLALSIQKQFNQYDSLIDNTVDERILSKYPPIFVAGSPRTGSTVLYQLLLSQFQLGYISNLMALIPSQMLKLAKLYPKAASGFQGAYKENDYGFVPGLFSPNEAGKIIGKWLNDIANGQEELATRRTLMTLSSIVQAPVLMKNQRRLTINIPTLLRVFPEARFIVTRRDPRFAAQSMLIARRKLAGGEQNWWNVMPEGYEKVLDKQPLYQVLWQVMSLQNIAESNLQNLLEQKHALILSYENMCQDTSGSLDLLHTQLGLQWRTDREAIPKLSASTKIQLTQREWEQMETYYQELKAEFDMEFPA